MIVTILILLGASVLASGVLTRHRRWLTFLAVSLSLFEGMWLLLTLVDRAVLESVASEPVYLIGSLIALGLFVSRYKKFEYVRKFDGWRELMVIVVLIPVIASAWLVASVNGFDETGEFVTHGFYNGDTATLVSLVEKSRLTTRLVNENPFAANGQLEYPTLIHGALAPVADWAGPDWEWFNWWPVLVYLQIFATIPLFFWLFDLVWKEPELDWQTWFGVPKKQIVLLLQAGVVAYVLSLSWDGFVYPQSHFFITGLFLLVIGLLKTGRIWNEVAGALVVLVLLMSNAVTGSAAVALAIIYCLVSASNSKKSVKERLWWLLGVPVWLILFLWLPPGEGALGLKPGFSYTAAFDMLKLALPVGILAVTGIKFLREQTVLVLGMTAMFGLALITFIFSERSIVVANASRFFYHGILIGFALVLPVSAQAWYWFKKEALSASLSEIQRLAGMGLAGILICLLIWPGLASIASTHDNLVFKNEQRLSVSELEELQAIRSEESPDAILNGNPDGPWWIPFLTGRALNQTNYWLGGLE